MGALAERIWLFGDYNQAESRLVAWKTPVPKLKQWYQEGVDVHARVAQLIARVVQENKIKTPLNNISGSPYFYSKIPNEFVKGDEERELSKRVVHAFNYGLGAEKLALLLGISLEFAQILLTIYGTLFPEIKRDYHGWVEATLKATRTIWMPEPVKFRKVFWDDLRDSAVLRSAYSCYPQCTIGALLSLTIAKCSKVFINGAFEAQWKLWYGNENWDRWCSLRDKGLRTPEAIRWSGMDVRLNIHDAIGVSIPNDPDLVAWAASTIKTIAEVPIHISPKESIVIPMDFKVGATWGNEDLKDYKFV